MQNSKDDFIWISTWAFSWPVDYGWIVLGHLLMILNPLGASWILECLLLEHFFWETRLMLPEDASFGHSGRWPPMNFHVNEPSLMPSLVNFWAETNAESETTIQLSKLACKTMGSNYLKSHITHK